MGFLSYNLNFYRDELKKLEDVPATEPRTEQVRRLLRMLDNLVDEGYSELSERIEKEFRGVSRMREYLRANRAEPFPAAKNRADAEALSWSEQETELNLAIRHAVWAAKKQVEDVPLPFAGALLRFCQWVGYDPDTAYVFLLRDTLLPFVYYLDRGRAHIFPWLLSRKSFAELTGKRDADDEIRASVYRALEAGCTDSRAFFEFVLPDIRKTIASYPQAEHVLRAMLDGVDSKRILVVEAGCSGTFPLLLMSMDSRVDMRMYTTYPYLTGIYGTRIFTSHYEESRMLETMTSQALLFRFSGIRAGR